MKKLESTKIRILLCSIIVSSFAAEHASPHRKWLPRHGTSSPRKKSQNSALPIQIPAEVLATQEVSCISADTNIFEIMREAKKTCRGNDMKCTFYLFANLKYYNIGSLHINKDRFDKLLMKYDNWLLTAEKIAENDTSIDNKDQKYLKKVKELDTSPQSVSSTFTEENSIKPNCVINENEATSNDSNPIKDHTSRIKSHNRTHMNTENSIRNIDLKEKNGKYIELIPKYDKEHGYFEVFLPENEDQGTPRTINVNINYENDKPLAPEREIETKTNIPMSNELKEISALDNYDGSYKNEKLDHNFYPLSTNIRVYDEKYLNENAYNNQRDPGSKDKTYSNNFKPVSFQETEADATNLPITNIFSTDLNLEQPRVEINDDSDKIKIQNDTLIIDDTNVGLISPANDQESLIHTINMNSSNQDMNFSNSDFENTNDTTVNKVSPQDTSIIELTSSITANDRDLNYATNDTLEEILISSRNNDNVRALNENIETLVLNEQSQTNILTPDIKPDINENIHLNTAIKDGHHENDHEKHNLTPLQNQTKHMHDLVDQATLSDDLHANPLEYTNIYNDHDFENTHLSVHDNNTLSTSNIHLNEPVFITKDSFRENHLETSPYVVAVPKFEPTYHKVSDYIGTQINISPHKNKLNASVSAKPVPSLPLLHTTAISETEEPETILPHIELLSAPKVTSPSSNSPTGSPSSTNSLLHSDVDLMSTYDVQGSRLPTLAIAPTESDIEPYLGSGPVISENEISLDVTPNPLLISEANSVQLQNEATISIDESSIANDLNILDSLSISPGDTSSQIELDEIPKSNWYIEKTDPFVTTPVIKKPINVNFQQKPQSYISKPTESSPIDLDLIPGTSLIEMASAKPIHKQTDEQIPLPTRLENPYFMQTTTDQTPTSKSRTPESKTQLSLLSETSTCLDDNLSQSTEPISLIPLESMTSLVPEGPVQESAILNPLISQDQPLIVNKIPQHKIPSQTNHVISDVDLQNQLSAEELNDLTQDELQLDQVLKPLLGAASFSKENQFSDISHDSPSKHKPMINLSFPISSSNYSPLAPADITVSSSIPQSDIPETKYTSLLPNEDFVAVPTLKPYYSKIPHIPTSTDKPKFNTKLSKNQPLILDNNNVLAALNKFSKSTKTNPLLDEEFQSIIKELPSDLTKLLLSESSLADTHLKLPITDSVRPVLNQYQSIDETTQSSEELLNLPSPPASKSQTILQSSLGLIPVYNKPTALEHENLKQYTSLPSDMTPELNKDSSSFLQPLSLAEYSTTPTLTDSYTHVSTSTSVPTSPDKDFSMTTKSSATYLPFDNNKVALEIVPIALQPDNSPQVSTVLANTSQLDIVSPDTLTVAVSEPTTGYESQIKQLDLIKYERPVPSLPLDFKSPQFYKESESLLENLTLETKPGNLLSESKSTQFYEENVHASNDLILETLAPDVTEKEISITPFTYKPSLTPKLTEIPSSTLSLGFDDSTINTYMPTMESPLLSSVKPISTSTSVSTSSSPVDRLSPLLKVSEKQPIPELSMSETILSDLGPSDDLINLHTGSKPIVINQLEVPISKSSSVLSASTTTDSLLTQNSLKKYITPHHNISPTDINQLSTALFMLSDISPLEAPLMSTTLGDKSPLVDTQKLQSLVLAHQLQPHPSDLLDSLKLPPFASTALDVDTTFIPGYEPSLEYIPQFNVLQPTSKSLLQPPPSAFYTPLTYTNPVWTKSKPVPQNSLLLTPYSFAHVALSPQLPLTQYNIPLSPSLITEISQPLLYGQSELPSVIGKILGNTRTLEWGDLQSNLFSPLPLVDALSQLDIPCQKILQTPLTLPDQSQDFLTASEITVNDPSCIEPSLPLNSNNVPSLPTNIFMNEELSEHNPVTPHTPIPSSPYIPIRPTWQIQSPSSAKNLQLSEPPLYVDSQVANAEFSSIPCKHVFKPLLDITSKIGPDPEVSNIDSHIPVEEISLSSIIKPKFNILPNIVPTKYNPIHLNDIRPLLDEDVSQFLKGMSLLPFTQTSKGSTLTVQERPINEDEILSPLESPICPNPIVSTAPKLNKIGSMKDSDNSPITNYYTPLKASPLKLTLPMPALISPILKHDIPELSFPVNSVLPFGDISTILSNVNPCLSKSEISLPSLSSRPLDFNLLPSTLSQLEYEPILGDISSVDTEFAQNKPSESISNVVEKISQDNIIQQKLNPKLIPMQTVLPYSMPCPTSSPLIYLNPLYSAPHQFQQPLNLKIPKASSKFPTLPVCSRPISTKYSQPLIEESLFSTASSKLPPTRSYTDINFAKLKPQIMSQPTMSIPLQSASYTPPILLSEKDILTTSAISSPSPQVITPQYTLTPSFYTKPLHVENFTPMKKQYHIIPNILETIESMSKPTIDKKSQLSSIPSVKKVSSSPLNIIQTKPLYSSSMLPPSPLQFHPSSLSPVYVNPMPQYMTPILPTPQDSPLKTYPNVLSPTLANPAPLAKSIPILPVQPDSIKLLPHYAMSFTSQVIPSVPLEVHPITQASGKPIPITNSVPLLPAYSSSNRPPSDFTIPLSPTYPTLSQYYYLPTPKRVTVPVSTSPCKLSENPSRLQLPENLTPASYVEATPWFPSIMGNLSRLSATSQSPIFQQSIPVVSPTSQYSIPAAISGPISQTFTKPAAPAYTASTLPPTSLAQSYMRPLSQKPVESLLPENVSPVSATNSYLSLSAPSTILSYTRPRYYTSSLSDIEPVLSTDSNYEDKRPLSQLQKVPLNIPSYGKNPVIHEIKNIPMTPNINTMKNFAKYGPKSTSASIFNLLINENDLENNIIGAAIAPSAETTILESFTSGIPEHSISHANIWTDSIGVSKEFRKESNIGTYLEPLFNVVGLDETTEMLSQGDQMPSISVPTVSNIPLSSTTIHKKPDDLIPLDILKLEEGKEMLLDEDSLEGNYLSYPAIRSIPIEPEMAAKWSERPLLKPVQSYTPLSPPGVAPQSLSLQSSSNFKPLLSTPILPLKPTPKSPMISSQFASNINPLSETGYTVQHHPYYNVLPLQKQPQSPILSLPYFLIPITEYKMPLEQSVPQYASTSSDSNRLVDIMFSQKIPQSSQVPTAVRPTVPLQSYITPLSKTAPPISPSESYATSPYIPYNIPTYVKPSYNIPWKQSMPVQSSPIPINKHETPITTYSSLQDSNLLQSKIVQTLIPSEGINHVTLPNEGFPAIGSPIYSQSNVAPTQGSSSSTTLRELENSLITPVAIKPSPSLNAELQTLQSNQLSPLGNTPKYSSPIETRPYYTSSRFRPTLFPSHFKPYTQFSENQFKIPISYPQSEEATKPHPKITSKPRKHQLNAPTSSPLTYAQSEFQSYESLKPHPKLLAALHQNAISPSTTDSPSILDTMTPLDILSETYIPSLPQYRPSIPVDGIPICSSPLLKPLVKANFKTRPEIFHKPPKTLLLPSRFSHLGTIEAPSDISSNSAEMMPIDQLYSSSLVKTLRNPIYTKESLLAQTEVPSDYMKYELQSPLTVLDGHSLSDSGPWLLPTTSPLLKRKLLKPSSQNGAIRPKILQYLEITPPKQSPLVSNYEHLTPSQQIESMVIESPIIESKITSSMPVTKSPLTNKYQSLISMPSYEFQDPLNKSQLPSLFSSPTKGLSTATPSWIKPLSLTSADAEFLKSSISQSISHTHSPLIFNPLDLYDSHAYRWNSGPPNSNASQWQSLNSITDTNNLIPNQYQSYSQYKILESLPTPIIEAKAMETANIKEEAAIPFSWSSIPSSSFTLLPQSSPDITISKLSEPNYSLLYTASYLENSLPVLTSPLFQTKEVSQIPSEYSNLNVSVFSASSPVSIEAKVIDNIDFTETNYSPTSPFSQTLFSQSSSKALPSSNILQYLLLPTYSEGQLVKPLTDRSGPVSPKLNMGSITTPLPTRPGNWVQSPKRSKLTSFYETPLDIIPQKEYLKMNPNKLTPNLKQISNPPGELKFTLIEEPLKLNSVKLTKHIRPITIKEPNITYKTIQPMEITPHLTEYSPDISNTEKFMETQTTPAIIGIEPEVSYVKYEEHQNIESDNLKLNQMPVNPQYLPSNKIYTYSPYTYIDYDNETPKVKKPTTPNNFQFTKAPYHHIHPTSLNSELSDYSNFYTNNHIGDTPKLFSTPTTIINDYNELPINTVSSEIGNGNNIESLPKLAATPLSLNELKTTIPVDTPIPKQNLENISPPCLNICSKTKSPISPTEICQTPIDFTEIPCPDSEIKYQGYKTYYPCSDILQSSTKFSQSLPTPLPLLRYENQNLNVIPSQAKLGLDNIHQDVKLYEHTPVEDIHDHKEVDNELKSILINYVNSKKDLKNNLFNNNDELTIPLGDLAINKKEPGDVKAIETNNPSIGLKVWKSNVKIVTAELKLKFKELSVNNFMPVINNLNEFDVEEIRKIVKDYIDEKYGNHIEIHEPYAVDNQYVVLKDFDQNTFDNKFNLLWPTEYV